MKQIIVPKDEKAMEDLDYDIAEESQLITWNLTEEEYKKLVDSNIFELFNAQCDSLIDEYEDDKILYDKLDGVKAYLTNNNSYELKKLNEFVIEAIKRKTAIHFYF
jgi:hypothetical protein